MHQPLIHKMMFLNDILHTMTSETSENIFSADIKVSKFRLHGCNMYSGADLEEGGGVGGFGPFPSLEKSNVLNKCTL